MHHCPTWQWATGDDTKAKPYLPKNKQFLITRNVPCSRRWKQIECSDGIEKVIESNDCDNGWVDTHYIDPSGIEEKVSEMNLENQVDEMPNLDECNLNERNQNNISGKNGNVKSIADDCNGDNNDDDNDEEAYDMEEFEREGFPLDDDEVIILWLLSK